jgi:hypothetical protein
MNVADKDLCEKLAKLSGWVESNQCWTSHGLVVLTRFPDFTLPRPVDYICPAYSIGYLMQKLPHKTRLEKFTIAGDPDKRRKMPPKDAFNCYLFTAREQHWNQANTPENALCKLAIALLENGAI